MPSEYCAKCHKIIEFTPRKQLIAMPQDIYVVEPHYCPFCKDKGFRVFVYEWADDQRHYGVNELYELADKTGISQKDLEDLFKEHKANCLAAAELEPRNLVEMLTERSEQYRIERNFDKL